MKQTTGRAIPEWGKWLISLCTTVVAVAVVGGALYGAHWLVNAVPAQWWGLIGVSVFALGMFAVIVCVFYQMLFGE